MSTNIAKLVERGEEALRKKNFDYAITVLLEAVSFAPDNRNAREALRRAELRKLEHSYPSGLAVAIFGLPARFGMFFAGLGKKGNPEAYMMACEKFLRIDPKNRAVNVALGEAAAMAGHINTAIFAYETATEHNPTDVSALKKLGQLLWKSGEISRAHDVYDKAVKLDPKDQEALKARKNLAAEASLKETGFETARSSRDLIRDKDAAGKLEQEARLYQTDEDMAEHRRKIEERLESEPDNVHLLEDLAEMCQKQGDWDGAAAALDRAIEAKPGDDALRFARDDIDMERLEGRQLELLKEGKKAEAEALEGELMAVRTEAYRRRVKAYPTDLNLRFKLGQLLLQQGKIDEAIGEFQQTVRDPKFRSESQLRLGQAFGSKGQFDLAIRQLEGALEGQGAMTDRVKEIRYVLGDVLESKGDPAAAKEQFGMIYESDIAYRDVSDRLAKLESA